MTGPGAARERAAFQDPYAVLAQLAAQYSAAHPVSVDVIVGDERKPGLAGGEVDRDPFDPVYWQLAATPPAKTDHPGDPGSAAAVPDSVKPDAAALASHEPSASEKVQPAAVAAGAAPAAMPPANPAEMQPAAAAVAAEEPKAQPLKAVSPDTAPVAAETAKAPVDDVLAAAKTVNAEIAQSVKATMAGDASPTLSVTATAEGVVIDLTDDANFSMFDVGSAVPDAKVVVLMEEIAKILAKQPGDVVVRGHTDGRPFHSDVYDNWRLSAARAHMAYYMLVRGGLDEKRVVRIEGYADRALKVPAVPYAAENRRIEILLMGPKT